MSQLDSSQAELVRLDNAIVGITRRLEEVRSGGHFGAPDEAVKADLEELEAALQFVKDAKVAHSIAIAIDNDAEALSSSAQDEACAQDDRNLAIRMAINDPELEDPLPGVTETPCVVSVEDELSRRLSDLIAADDSLYEDPPTDTGPTVSHVERQAQALKHLSRSQYQCCACTDHYRWDKVTQLACGDYYCAPCLRRVVLRAVVEKDLAYLPPRCCRGPIPQVIIEKLLSEEEKSDLRLAELEKGTVDKTYCSDSKCGKFIPPSDIHAGQAICNACGTTTCSLCKSACHESDCPKDEALQATLQLAAAQNWQRCYSCRTGVEINYGCNHITCRCGAEFCYLCGVRWRNCLCEQFTEANLLHRAAQIVDRAAPAPLPARERRRQIAQVQNDLRAAEECDHSGGFRNFVRINGDGHHSFGCDICDARHWAFIFRCRRCRVDFCMTCRYNRI